MTRPIGERFMHDGVLLEVCDVTPDTLPCLGCYFDDLNDSGEHPLRRYPVTGECTCVWRSDHRDVIFMRVKEGGEE